LKNRMLSRYLVMILNQIPNDDPDALALQR